MIIISTVVLEFFNFAYILSTASASAQVVSCEELNGFYLMEGIDVCQIQIKPNIKCHRGLGFTSTLQNSSSAAGHRLSA